MGGGERPGVRDRETGSLNRGSLDRVQAQLELRESPIPSDNEKKARDRSCHEGKGRDEQLRTYGELR